VLNFTLIMEGRVRVSLAILRVEMGLLRVLVTSCLFISIGNNG
jgi:hypothetical protein